MEGRNTGEKIVPFIVATNIIASWPTNWNADHSCCASQNFGIDISKCYSFTITMAYFLAPLVSASTSYYFLGESSSMSLETLKVSMAFLTASISSYIASSPAFFCLRLAALVSLPPSARPSSKNFWRGCKWTHCTWLVLCPEIQILIY